jgi:hypothetical protein
VDRRGDRAAATLCDVNETADLPFSIPMPEHSALDAPRPGQLTQGWSTLFGVGWLLIMASFAAIWYSSRLVGLSTWWLGPETEPRLLLVNLLPFTVPAALGVAGFQRKRFLPWWGLGGAAFVALIAAFDVNATPGYAAIEFGLAGAGLCVSSAALAGMYRRASAD